MNKLKVITAMIMTCSLTAAVLTGCGQQGDNKSEETSKQEETTSQAEGAGEGTQQEAETYEYTWDITVVFPDITDGEKDQGIDESNPASTVNLTNPGLEDWDDQYKNQRFTFTRENNTAEMKIMDISDWIVDNSQDWYKWIFDDGDFGYTCLYEVVTPLTEFDTETHGELTITLQKPDYYWDITVVYENGAAGEYGFTNPGLEGWDDKYINQRFTFTPEENTAQMPIFDPFTWEVDNTQAWYLWVVNDVNDEGGVVTFEVTEGLEAYNFAKHGALTIHITLP